jgi:hypothetical protein
MEINRARLPADRLGEIVNPATISTYFTRRGGYFYSISIVFPPYFQFLLHFRIKFTIPLRVTPVSVIWITQ